MLAAMHTALALALALTFLVVVLQALREREADLCPGEHAVRACLSLTHWRRRARARFQVPAVFPASVLVAPIPPQLLFKLCE